NSIVTHGGGFLSAEMFRSRQPYFSSIRRLLQLPLIHNIPLYLMIEQGRVLTDIVDIASAG
ncbi:hypothetical protein, partial [Noviherbaspirillum malthae]|uniref:hypothetical protein n=1 Tax=Noviherbaspirillum malthae TaxID=1260987 RepID=UPI001E485100